MNEVRQTQMTDWHDEVGMIELESVVHIEGEYPANRNSRNARKQVTLISSTGE